MKTVLDREDLLLNPVELGCVLSLTGLPGGSNKIHDRSPYGNTGTIVGATWVRLPSGLWVLSFDATDDYVSVSSHTSISPTDTITLLTWVKADDANFGAWNGKLFFKRVAGQTYSDYALDIIADGEAGAGYIRFQFYSGGGWQANVVDTSRKVGDDVWHLAGVTYDRTNYIYYVDGVQGDSHGETSAMAQSGGALNLGKGEQVQTKFSGLLALPRVINRVLSALEIQNIYNREKHLFGVW